MDRDQEVLNLIEEKWYLVDESGSSEVMHLYIAHLWVFWSSRCCMCLYIFCQQDQEAYQTGRGEEASTM